jgi:hypothetical protein
MPGPSPAPIHCPYTGPNIINPAIFPSCASSTCSNAHCLPASLVPAAQQALLQKCSGGGYCTPDPIIASANHFVPPTCTSIAGAEGRCISTCLPSIEQVAAILPKAGCAAGTVCAPCYNPTAADPTAQTGACQLGCDAPTKPPVILTCPWPTPPPVIDPTTMPGCGCTGAHCLPAIAVPASSQSNLNTCSDPSFGAGFCTPDEIIATGGNIKPPGCAPFAGVTNSTQGRCLSDCLKTIQANPTLEQSSCASNDKCAPCWDPFSGVASGACSLSKCDMPPSTAYTFPNCCIVNRVATGRCIPLSQIPAAQQGNLQADECANINGNYLCVPDEQLPAPHNTPGQACTGGPTLLHLFGYSGTCLSDCLKFPPLTPLAYDQGTCPNNYTCIGCADAPAGSPGC